jgi:hypothetical protein
MENQTNIRTTKSAIGGTVYVVESRVSGSTFSTIRKSALAFEEERITALYCSSHAMMSLQETATV